MSKKAIIIVLVLFFPLLFSGITDQNHVILGWNDLGMHCSNKNFVKLAILPPYNNLMVQVIEKGSASSMPTVLTTGVTVTYEVPGNTYSVGKTDFWTYVQQLFGQNPAPNTGLTGAGLSGNMSLTDNYFHVEGIPVTAYPDSDLVNQHPYQLALMKAYDANNNLIGETRNVIPVSHEINCVSSGCHNSEQNIRNAHPNVSGYNTSSPILCASCHADNALGTTGSPGTPNFSRAIHATHAGETNDCYKCHPGPQTQCYRDIMHTNGITCQNCHGSVSQVASSIQAGRDPWLEEPSCSSASCHNANHAPEPNKLYRQSKGHGGLFCSACHGSPHAIVPTTQPNDNLQNITYQGFAGKLEVCSVCHGITPNMPGPHGYMPASIDPIPGDIPVSNVIGNIYPNPASGGQINFNIRIRDGGKYKIGIYDINGKQVAVIANQGFGPGNYHMECSSAFMAGGIYFARMAGTNASDTRKFLVD